MITEWNIDSIADVIQVAVTPVFLLAGIAGLLNVMSGRLSRIVDRMRGLAAARQQANDPEHEKCYEEEIEHLRVRGKIVNYAISFATSSALVICLVVIMLFAGGLIGDSLSMIIALLFIICMALLIVALFLFIREIYFATATIFSSGSGEGGCKRVTAPRH